MLDNTKGIQTSFGSYFKVKFSSKIKEWNKIFFFKILTIVTTKKLQDIDGLLIYLLTLLKLEMKSKASLGCIFIELCSLCIFIKARNYNIYVHWTSNEEAC